MQFKSINRLWTARRLSPGRAGAHLLVEGYRPGHVDPPRLPHSARAAMPASSRRGPASTAAIVWPTTLEDHPTASGERAGRRRQGHDAHPSQDRADASMVQGIAKAYDLILTGYDAYSTASRFRCCWTRPRMSPWASELLAGRLIAESQRLLAEAGLPRRKRPNGGRSAAFHSADQRRRAPGWGLLLRRCARSSIRCWLPRCRQTLVCPLTRETSSSLGATKVAPYGFSQRDRSYALAFFLDASMRTSTSTAITMSNHTPSQRDPGFFVKPAMM